MSFGAIVPLADSWGMHGGTGAGWMIAMIVGMVIFWGAIIALIVSSIGSLNRSHRGREQAPLNALERRFAEGTITAEDYRERREILGAAASTTPASSRARPLFRR